MEIVNFIQIHKILIVQSNYIIKNTVSDIYICQKDLENILIETNSKTIKIEYLNKFKMIYSFDNKIILINTLNIESTHILRIIKSKLNNYIFNNQNSIDKYYFESDVLGEFLIELNNLLKLNIFDYCTCCGNSLEIFGLNKIDTCSKNSCKECIYFYPIDYSLTNIILYDPLTIWILSFLLLESIRHPKGNEIMTSIPKLPGVNNYQEYSQYVKNNLDIMKIENFLLNIKNLKKSNNINIINEIYIFKNLGSNLYLLVKLACVNNYFLIRTQTTLDNAKSNTNIGFRLINNVRENFDSNSIQLLELNYPAYTENSFNTEYYLYHGAPIYAWHYIIKNGLKIMSGTQFQANGAAYGNGIYTSCNFNTSLTYCKNGLLNVLGIFEILDCSKYPKNNIVVIKSEKDILLRQLIIVSKNFTNGNFLDNYFIKNQIKISNNLKKNNMYSNCEVRLNKEYELLLLSNHIDDIKIIKTNQIWEIILMNQIYGYIKIQLNFYDYPIYPPTIKLLENKIKLLPKLKITIDNILLMDETNLNKWTIKNNLVDIIGKLNKYIY